MKLYLYLFFLFTITTYLRTTASVCAADAEALDEPSSKTKFYSLIRSNIKEIANHVTSNQSFRALEIATSKFNELKKWLAAKEQENTFIGRCFGAAKHLKVVMPIILMKLGVIITMLAFLTFFSMKTLALVIFLSFVTSTGIVKIGAAGSRVNDVMNNNQPAVTSSPQNVHYHIQTNKDPWATDKSSDHSYLFDKTLSNPLLTERLALYQHLMANNAMLNTDTNVYQ